MARPPIYVVTLTKEERRQLKTLTKTGKAAAYRIKHANILLLCDQNRRGGGLKDQRVAESLGCGIATIGRIRQRFVEEGFEAALERKKQESPSRERIIDGDGEARLVTLACSQPPQGSAQWTMQLLADKLVELNIVESVSRETVRGVLKKRAEALEGKVLVHSSGEKRGVRCRDGRRP
jgi:transposase